MSQKGARTGGEFVLYAASEGDVRVSVLFEGETVWRNQKTMAEIFGVNVPAIAKHIKNILDSGELVESAVVSILETTANDGKSYRTKHYSLDTIIAVGYRVNSYQATRFRIWATQVLRDFMIKGFALDDERLKRGKALFGKDYFEELLERIREIRASERRFYQKITDIYATAVDYDPKAPLTRDFFASVQNKLHWAINRIISAYLDLAENRATRGIVMKMQDWVGFLDRFLELSDYKLLDNPGRVGALEARLKAEGEYDKFRVRQDQDYVSDFDKEVARLTGKDNR